MSNASRGGKRVRYGTLPTPSDCVQVPYAQCREALADLSYGQITNLILRQAAWREVMDPILAELDAERGTRGRARGYTARECESALLFQRVAGERGYKAARDLLAGDRHADARRFLGFDRDRGFTPTRGTPERWLRAGIPSEASISRHKKRFGLKRRNDVYRELKKRLRADLVPLLGDEARILYLDGTKIETHFMPPKTTDKDPVNHPKWKRVINREKKLNRQGKLACPITAPDAGYVGRGAPADHSGAGWNLGVIITESGIPLAERIVPLQKYEGRLGIRLIEDFNREIRPLLSDPNAVRVATTDGAFRASDVRAAWRKAGVIENTHFASHADRATSRANAARMDAARYRIDGYPNYYANGHREIFCACGSASFASRSWVDRHSRAHTRIEGTCPNCGPISITAGRWRPVDNVRGTSPDASGREWNGGYVRCVYPEDFASADLAFGNSLTYHDRKAAIYGRRRFGHNEGFNGQLHTRFEHLKGKRWFRRRAQAETDTNIVFSIILALALEQKRAAAEQSQRGSASESPPLDLAA